MFNRLVLNSADSSVRLVNSNSSHVQVVDDLVHGVDWASQKDDSSSAKLSSSAGDSDSDKPPPPGSQGDVKTPVDAITQTPSKDKIKEEREKVKKETKDGVKKPIIKEERKSPPKDLKDVKTELEDGGRVVKQETAAVSPGGASFRDLESGKGQLGKSHDNEKTPTASKNAGRATPKLSRWASTPRLGQTYNVSPVPGDPNAISLPVIPPQVGLIHDLDTHVAAPKLLRLCPEPDPGLNSLLQNQTELMEAHNANVNGFSEIGDYAGK